MAEAIEGLQAEFNRILSPLRQEGNPSVPRQLHNVSEARLYQRELGLIQTQLRSFKANINHAKKQTHLMFDHAQTNANNHPFVAAFAGKKKANHLRAQEKQRLRAREQMAVRPYELLAQEVDAAILRLDQMKLDIDKAIQGGQIR